MLKQRLKQYVGVMLFCICAICIGIKILQTNHYNKAAFILPPYIEIPRPSQKDLNKDDKKDIINLLIPNDQANVHSSSIAKVDSTLMVVYFAGSKEGARDVKIYQSFLDKNSQTFSKPRAILSPEWLSSKAGKFIKKLGNPVVFVDSNNKVHIFVVGVSLGGWATSKIYQLYFEEDLQNLHYVRELHLGGFVNFSHLVRTPPVLLENGGFMLPLYHELADKYPLVAFFDENGEMLFSRRLNTLKAQLQPSLIATSQTQCLGVSRVYKMRYEGFMYLQQCDDKGNVWYPPYQSDLKNYDSSSVLINANGEILLLHNDGIDNPLAPESRGYAYARATLSLFWLEDKNNGHFKHLMTLDTSENSDVSYPAALLDSDFLHITYTYNHHIKYQRISLESIHKLIAKKRQQLSKDSYFTKGIKE